jgi:pimeloyl-ACP methyl ester carboxylesterase
LAELIDIPGTHGEVTSHVIFFHGLGGHPYDTWRSLIEPKVCWLQWLAEDIEGLAVWTIGYDSGVSRWRGHAMHLTDRAANLLERILLEPKLQTGEIALIGHSLGGLVIKQLLRTAESLAHHRQEVANFIQRVRRVAFLATPHTGVDLAKKGDRLRVFLRPSAATASLVRNDPNLRELNHWYREWSAKQDVAHLTLTESRPLRIIGLLVKPDTSDPGVSSRPISIDADHISICKPTDRSSEVYAHIRKFLTRQLNTTRSDPVVDALKEHSTQLKALNATTQEGFVKLSTVISEQGEETANIVADRLKNDLRHLSSPSLKYPREIVDDLIQKDLSIMQRARFFQGFSRAEHSLRLADKILNDELEGGSSVVKSRALAWCSRVLALGDTGDTSDEFLRRAKQLGDGPEIAIAEAFRISANGNVDGALSTLADIDSPSARSAAFFIVTNHKDASAAIEWLSTVGVKFSDLDADGKFYFITKLLELGRWDTAIEYVDALLEDDFQQAPALFHAAAMSNLVQAVPGELRSVIFQQLPFEANIFPLGSNAPSLQHRRKAQVLFQKSTIATRELGCAEVSNLSEDYALWLELRDPEGCGTGLEKLQMSMRDPEHSLRRLHLALQFGLKLDIDAVEKEIDRRTALSGGKSHDAALARFSLAFVQKSPKGVADYIDRHRTQLESYWGRERIGYFEIEMLARAGLPEQAEEHLAVLVNAELSETRQNHLRRIISEATGTDPIEARKAQFQKYDQLVDLANLVRLLEERDDWPQLCYYGSILFERTKAVPDAERLALALNEAGRFSELTTLLQKYPEFLDQSDTLQTLWSWSLYREGLLAESAAALEKLRLKRDHRADRNLTVRLAVASGEWGALLPFIEAEWARREKRAAKDLMQTAHLAHVAGSPRTKDLVCYAVSKDGDNPYLLMAAYSLATNAGWENDETVSHWLHRAAELSNDSGPIRKMSMKDILDRAPEWNRRERDIWQEIYGGNLPLYIAANILNKTLADIFLLPALANFSESDPRRRALVPAYSGVRQSLPCNFCVVAIDATALLTLGMLDLLEAALDFFDCVMISHSTLPWLFEEKQEVSFHQPSRIRNASKLRELLAIGALKAFSRSAEMNADLATEIGEGLASLIVEASSMDSGDERQRLVIRPSPVHRIGSLMDEEADLSPYYSHLCSCSSIVNKLKQKGQLTATEESRARSYLSLHEKEWPCQPDISDNAVLYLDDISVTYLQHTGLLEKLRPAGLDAYVSESTIEEINALLRYEQLASRVSEIIENIRISLMAGIKTGKVKLSHLRQIDETEELKLRDHPTFEIFDLAKEVEAIIVDDRAFNKHRNFNSGSNQALIMTTLDLINALHLKGNLSLNQWLDYRTEMRRAGYLFVPLTNDELEHYISAATVVDRGLVETAELKAIRENFLSIRMNRFLQLPFEAPWLQGMMQAFTHTLKAQWNSELNEAEARTRSEWLLRLLDGRGWAHCFAGIEGLGMAKFGYGSQIILLLSVPPNTTLDTREKYFKWIDEEVLANIAEEDPEVNSWINERAKELIAQLTKMDDSEEIG